MGVLSGGEKLEIVSHAEIEANFRELHVCLCQSIRSLTRERCLQNALLKAQCGSHELLGQREAVFAWPATGVRQEPVQ